MDSNQRVSTPSHHWSAEPRKLTAVLLAAVVLLWLPAYISSSLVSTIWLKQGQVSQDQTMRAIFLINLLQSLRVIALYLGLHFLILRQQTKAQMLDRVVWKADWTLACGIGLLLLYCAMSLIQVRPDQLLISAISLMNSMSRLMRPLQLLLLAALLIPVIHQRYSLFACAFWLAGLVLGISVLNSTVVALSTLAGGTPRNLVSMLHSLTSSTLYALSAGPLAVLMLQAARRRVPGAIALHCGISGLLFLLLDALTRLADLGAGSWASLAAVSLPINAIAGAFCVLMLHWMDLGDKPRDMLTRVFRGFIRLRSIGQ